MLSKNTVKSNPCSAQDTEQGLLCCLERIMYGYINTHTQNKYIVRQAAVFLYKYYFKGVV